MARVAKKVERSPCGRYWYDERAAEAAAAFFPRYLRFTEGEWAGRPFTLEPWQEHDIVRPLFGWKREDGTRRYRRCYVWVPRKNGKALALDTPIPTPQGWTTMGALQVGDQVYDEQGLPCRVTYATEVMHGRPCYRVAFSDGTSIVADAEHQWWAASKYRKARVVTTEEMRACLLVGKRETHVERNWTIPLGAPLQGVEQELPLDPYVLGAWLGDGTQYDARITLGPNKESVRSEIERRGVALRCVPSAAQAPAPTWWMHHVGAGRPAVMTVLRSLGVLENKHIPTRYLRASIEQRRQLLQGLIDTDGHVEGYSGQIEFVTVVPALRDGMLDLLRGLGFKATWTEDRSRLNGEDRGPRYRIRFFAGAEDRVCLREQHIKRLRDTPTERRPRRRTLKVVAIDPVPSVPVRCIEVDSGSHLYRAGAGMTVTHNTEIAAGIALLMLLGDGERGGQVFSIAADQNQASIVFGKATTMVQWSEALSKHLTCFKRSIFCQELMARFEALSGNPGGKHGLNMSGLIGDEIHEWRDDRLYTFVHQSAASRRQPLEFLISTAGERRGYGWEAWQYCQRQLAGEIEDPETLVVIYAADADDDWQDPATWKKANPNLGVSVKLEYLQEEARKARELPRLENDFRRYHLNQWTEQAVRWLPMDAWDECGHPAPETIAKARKAKLPAWQRNERWRALPALVAGRPAAAGLDLSSTTDLTALVWAVPPEEEGGRWILLPRFFVPEARIMERARRDRVPYDQWVKMGAMVATPGNVVDYSYVKRQLYQDAETYPCIAVAIDRWNATQIATEIRDEGLNAVLFGQGYASMSGPTKELERLVLDRRVDHGGHPVLRWCAGNVAIDTDAAGNIKPAKDKSTERIDGMVASIMGIGIALAQEPEGPSVYESRGLLSVG